MSQPEPTPPGDSDEPVSRFSSAMPSTVSRRFAGGCNPCAQSPGRSLGVDVLAAQPRFGTAALIACEGAPTMPSSRALRYR